MQWHTHPLCCWATAPRLCRHRPRAHRYFSFLKDSRNKSYCLITAHYTYFSKHVIQTNLPSSQILPLVSDPLSMQTHISNAHHMEGISKPVGFAPGLRLKSSQFFFLHTLGLLKLFPNVFVSHMSNTFPQKLDMPVRGVLWEAVSSPQRMTSAWVSGTQQQTDEALAFLDQLTVGLKLEIFKRKPGTFPLEVT